jgi:hypothetical protein
VSFETIFMFELLLAAVVVAVILGGVIYLAIRNRRTRHETGREVGKADDRFGTAPEETTEDTVGRVPLGGHPASRGANSTRAWALRRRRA